MAKLTLSPDLEKALLKAVIKGVSPLSLLSPEELSKEGRQVYNACNYLVRNGAKQPLDPAAVLMASVNLGADREQLRSYLRQFDSVGIGSDVQALGRAARAKETLVSIINEAGEQLANGSLDTLKLNGLLSQASKQQSSKLTPFADEVKDSFPVPPKGLQINSLPTINKATNGLIGIWIIGGIPGLGKSTLSWQIALDIARNYDVLYYDIDGTGKEWVIDRTRVIVGGSVALFKVVTKRLHYRESIKNLDGDLSTIKPPALVVVDSLQTLPTSPSFRRSSLDKWLSDFKEISQRGYAVVLVSEIGRGSYDEVKLGSFKESGAIEYAGAAAIQLFSEDPEDASKPVEFHMTKNRHGPKKGHIINLERHPEKVFWFKEVEEEF